MTHIDPATFLPLAPVPLAGMALTVWLWRDLWMKPGVGRAPDWRPYLLAAGVFLSGYLTFFLPFLQNISTHIASHMYIEETAHSEQHHIQPINECLWWC